MRAHVAPPPVAPLSAPAAAAAASRRRRAGCCAPLRAAAAAAVEARPAPGAAGAQLAAAAAPLPGLPLPADDEEPVVRLVGRRPTVAAAGRAAGATAGGSRRRAPPPPAAAVSASPPPPIAAPPPAAAAAAAPPAAPAPAPAVAAVWRPSPAPLLRAPPFAQQPWAPHLGDDDGEFGDADPLEPLDEDAAPGEDEEVDYGQPAAAGGAAAGRGGGRAAWSALRDGLLMGHEHEALDDATFEALLRSCRGLQPGWRPMVSFLHSRGLRAPELARLAAKEPQVFVGNVGRARSRVAYLQEAFGLGPAELVRVLALAPRVMFLHLDRMQKRAAFLESIALPRDRWGFVLARSPGFLYTTVDTMEPRVAYLCFALRLERAEVGRLVARHPKLLSNGTAMVESRLLFLYSLGLGDADVRRMVCSHPQLLNYAPEAMAPRVEWLLSEVGLSPEEAARVCARLGQLFSLSVERSLRPKWAYLTQRLGGCKATLLECPTYLSLSLQARIVPRHLFLASLGWRRGGGTPFNLWDLIHTDARFVASARSNLAAYAEFKAALAGGEGAAAPVGR